MANTSKDLTDTVADSLALFGATDLNTPSANRRDFLKCGMAAGFAVASQPLLAQAIKTDFTGIIAGEQSMNVEGDVVPIYVAKPDKQRAPLPIVIVVSEIFGVHEHIADVCRRFAKAGFMAIAPEFFSRIGDPSSYGTIAELQANIITKTPDAMVLKDIEATLVWAAQNGGDNQRAGITGFCWGGRITWLACAKIPQFKAGVAWYGRLTGDKNSLFPEHPLDIAGQLKSPVLGLYGGADTGIPMAHVEKMQGELKKSGNTAAAMASRIDVYADTPHAFHADYRPSYRPTEAKDAWEKALVWLKKLQA